MALSGKKQGSTFAQRVCLERVFVCFVFISFLSDFKIGFHWWMEQLFDSAMSMVRAEEVRAEIFPVGSWRRVLIPIPRTEIIKNPNPNEENTKIPDIIKSPQQWPWLVAKKGLRYKQDMHYNACQNYFEHLTKIIEFLGERSTQASVSPFPPCQEFIVYSLVFRLFTSVNLY